MNTGVISLKFTDFFIIIFFITVLVTIRDRLQMGNFGLCYKPCSSASVVTCCSAFVKSEHWISWTIIAIPFLTSHRKNTNIFLSLAFSCQGINCLRLKYGPSFSVSSSSENPSVYTVKPGCSSRISVYGVLTLIKQWK